MKTAFRIIFIIIINALLLSQINAQTPGLIIKPGNPAVFDPNGDGYISLDEFGFVSDDMTESELRFVSIATADHEPTEDPKGPSCHFNDIVDTGTEEPIMVRNDGTNFIVRFRQSTTVDNAKGYALLIDADGLFGAAEEGAGYSSSNPGFEIELTLLTKFGVYLNNIDNKSKGTVGGINDGFYSDLDVQSPVATRFQKSIALTNNCGDIDIFYEFYVPVADIEAAYPGFSSSLIRIVGLTTLNPLPTLGQANWSDLGGIDDSKYGSSEEIFNELIAVSSPTDPDNLDGSDPATLRYSECPDLNTVNTLTSIISGNSSEADGATINIYKNAVLLNSTTVSGGTWTYDASVDGLVAGDVITATALGINKKESSGCSNDKTVIACVTIPDPPIVTGTAPAEKGMIGTYSGTVTLPSTPEIDLYRIGFGVINDGTWNVVDWTVGTPSNWVKDRGAGSIDYGIYYAQAVGLSCESLPGAMYCYSKAGKGFDTPISITPTISVATQTNVSGTISGASINNTTIYLYEETTVGSGVYHLLANTIITAGNTTWAFSGFNISSCKNVKVYFVEPNIANTCQSESGAVQIGGSSTTAPVITDNGDCAPAVGTIITIQGTSLEQEGTIIKLYKNGSGIAEAQTGFVNPDGSWYIAGVSVAGNDYLKATALQDNACSAESSLSASQYDISLATPNTASIDVSLSDDAIAYRESDTDVSVTFSSAFTGTARLYIDQELIGLVNLSGSTSSNFLLPYTDIYGNEISLYAGGELTVTVEDGTNCESVHTVSETVQCTPPTNTLILSPDPSKVCYNEKGSFTIENTQQYVVYTPVKVSDGSIIGYSSLSLTDGSNITVNTHNLTVDPTDITVKMMKISRFICESTNTNDITFNVNSELTAGTSTAIDPTCATGSNGEIVASASGGSGTGYEFQLDDGAWQASPTFSDLSAGTYTVSIKDDELCADDQTDVILADGVGACSINISIDDVTLAEGNSGTTSFEFTISFDEAYGSDITIDYETSDNTATIADSDYQEITTTSTTIPAGTKTKTITVLVNGDATSESDETFNVDISNASFGSIIDSRGIGTITNDDVVANTAPVANDDSNAIDEDAVSVNQADGSGTLIFNDTDVDLDALTVSKVGAETNAANDVTGTYGTINWETDGTYIYTIDNSNAAVQALKVGATLT
ncbi:MAG: hypothetical protein GQ564_21990, partial [Bacteroidales bacterium]|nr:hypothetical protein [Bacteroidales bacterium]